MEHDIICSELNMGGGYGVRFTNDSEFMPLTEVFETMMHAVLEFCKNNNVKLPKFFIELERWMVGENDITFYTVGYEKHIEGIHKYVCVDDGMSNNIPLSCMT